MEEAEFQWNAFAAEMITSLELYEPLEGTFEGACFTHNDDFWHELTHIHFLDQTEAIASMKLAVTWKNQGSGESKGRLRLALMNGPDEIQSCEIFGVAPECWEDSELEFSA